MASCILPFTDFLIDIHTRATGISANLKSNTAETATRSRRPKEISITRQDSLLWRWTKVTDRKRLARTFPSSFFVGLRALIQKNGLILILTTTSLSLIYMMPSNKHSFVFYCLSSFSGLVPTPRSRTVRLPPDCCRQRPIHPRRNPHSSS